MGTALLISSFASSSFFLLRGIGLYFGGGAAGELVSMAEEEPQE